jgi:tetratricopeptide (TPR) repeat protein
MAASAIQQNFDLAVRHHQAGRLQEAEQLYRQVLAQDPRNADALHYLGVIAYQVGKIDLAVDLIRQAIAIKPDFPEAFSNLGNALIDQGQFDAAIAACRQAIRLNPTIPAAHHNLGNALNHKGQFDEAIAALREAIALNPDIPQAHNNLGSILGSKGLFNEATASFQNAIAIRPNYAEAHKNLGTALYEMGRLDEAIAAFRQAISIKPNYPEAHHVLSYALLTRGDFQSGWEEYEWRWKCNDFSSPARNFSQPQWTGEPLEGRTLLLHTEQGLGDAIQIIRYLPFVAQRGGRIILECQPELERLFRKIADGMQIVTRGQTIPPFDLHCPILSLPLVFQTSLANIPGNVPYLFPEPLLVDEWKRTLGACDGQLRIGLTWAGTPKFIADKPRSLNLQQLAPFAAVPGVKFFSLQKGPAGEQAKHPPQGMELVDLGPELKDMADTAAAMFLMDLIITTDTSIPHLAGALGRPVWTMLQFMPDWRWLVEREDSPWYPTMRLFRQSAPGDWTGPIQKVKEQLILAARTRSPI